MKQKNAVIICISFYCLIVSTIRTKSFFKLNEKALKSAESGDYNKAVKTLKKATKINRISAIAHYNIGYTHHLRGNYKLAIKSYKASIDRKSNFVLPHQNLGKVYYKSGHYKEAIEQANKVLKLNPKNKQVIKWLPDARKKYAQQQRLGYYEKSGIGTNVGYFDNTFLSLRNSAWYPIQFSYIIAGGFFINKNRNAPTFILLPTATRLPMYFYLSLKTLIQLHIKVGTAPVAGLLNPAFFIAEEIIELTYQHKKWFFGGGIMMSQFDTTVDDAIGFSKFRLNTDINTASDFKLGLLLEYQTQKNSFSVTAYPRYLFRDPIKSETRGISIDRNLFLLAYKSKVSNAQTQWTPSFLIEFKINESYISEYQTSKGPIIGHYFGYYDVNFGIIFPNFWKGLVSFPLTIGFKLVNRIYFADINDPKPQAFGNGQGFAGFSIDGLLEANTFSGLRSNSHKLLVFSKQRLSKLVSLQETIGFDYHHASNTPVHILEIYFQISLRL